MKLAIISSTIHDESGFLAFDELARGSPFEEVAFFIAGDVKTPSFDTSRFSCSVEFLDVPAQARFRCSEPMGWNKIMRRNIALLRAIEWRPNYILTIDDDNLPGRDYFDTWHRILTTPVRMIAEPAMESPPWFNYLRTSAAPIEIFPRGYPVKFRKTAPPNVVNTPAPILPSSIGLYQGISLGVCDVDAITHIVCPSIVSSISQKNYCVRDLWSPYNTQNTIFAPILFPLAFVWPFCGRFDDIYASFVWQRLLFNNRLYAHVGEPVNRQQRGDRDLLKDLANETEGYFNAHLVWEAINRIEEQEPIEFLEALIASEEPIIQRQQAFMKAFREDLQRVWEG